MKDLCKLVDGTLFEVEDTTLWSIDVYCDGEASALALCQKITPENVSTLRFYTQYEDGTENELIYDYDDVYIASLPTRIIVGDGRILVHLSFGLPDPVEVAVETNKTDITDIQMALVEIYEMIESFMG